MACPGIERPFVRAWGGLHDDDRDALDDGAGVAPRERLLAMMSSLVSPRHENLERAMRLWARSDPAVAASVRAADSRLLGAVRRAFLDVGLDADEAAMFATATFTTGIGFPHLHATTPDDEGAGHGRRLIDLMLARLTSIPKSTATPATCS